ncbi:hypothetical protein EBZ37_15275, partial [bacterium]|nr:hypothetical protein [bacterium]
MIRAGLPVPAGYVVFNFANLHEQRVRSAIFQAFDNLNVEEVAVRSSAGREDSRERSYAGSFASFLSVKRSNLLEKITQVRESSLGLSEEIDHKLGVVIQPMVKGQVSGVCFSRNPVAAGYDIVIGELPKNAKQHEDAIKVGVLTRLPVLSQQTWDTPSARGILEVKLQAGDST